MNTSNDYTIQSVEKTLKILKLFAFGSICRRLTVMEICDETGYSASSVMRMLYTLDKQKFIDFDKETKKYTLSTLVYQMGMVKYGTMDLVSIAKPYMKELTDACGLVTFLASTENGEVLVVDKAIPSSLSIWPRMTAQNGYTLPIYASGIGRLYLSQFPDEQIMEVLKKNKIIRYTENTIMDRNLILEEVRKCRNTNICCVDGEHDEYISSICVPIFDMQERMVAGISVGGASGVIFEPQTKAKCIHLLQDASHRIGRELGRP